MAFKCLKWGTVFADFLHFRYTRAKVQKSIGHLKSIIHPTIVATTQCCKNVLKRYRYVCNDVETRENDAIRVARWFTFITKSQFGDILEGLRIENVGICMVRPFCIGYVHMAIFYILWPFGIMLSHLV
jgi:hypothetical protein